MITLGNIMSVKAQEQLAAAQHADRIHRQYMRYRDWLQHAKRYDAPSSIPKVKRK